MSGGRVERALADLVGGADGGLTLWEIACGKLERVARAAREDDYRFRSHPSGRLERLRVDLDDALMVAELAAELQALLDADPLTADERAGDVASLLLGRARTVARDRQGGREGLRRLG